MKFQLVFLLYVLIGAISYFLSVIVGGGLIIGIVAFIFYFIFGRLYVNQISKDLNY